MNVILEITIYLPVMVGLDVSCAHLIMKIKNRFPFRRCCTAKKCVPTNENIVNDAGQRFTSNK